MSSVFYNTIKQLLMLTDFCNIMGIPFDVYGFTSCWGGTGGQLDKTPGTIDLGGCAMYNSYIPTAREGLLNYLSSKMNKHEYQRASINLLLLGKYHQSAPAPYRLGNTPLHWATIIATKLLPEFKAANNVQIVNTIFLTDGSSHSINVFSDAYNPNGNIQYSCDLLVVKDIASNREFRFTKTSIDTNYVWFKVLKELTGSNIIGFFVYNRAKFRGLSHLSFRDNFSPMKDAFAHADTIVPKLKRLYNKNLCVSIDDYDGYDQLNYISPELFNQHSSKKINSISGSTKRTIQTSFFSMVTSKARMGVLLEKFIEKIS
jgi:hypothetical protein